MPIELWSRKEGLLKPPAELLHATEGSVAFPARFRVRVKYWLIDACVRFPSGTDMVGLLYRDLRREYGRHSLVDVAYGTEPGKQIGAHVETCPDTEVLDLINAVFQESAYLSRKLARFDLVGSEPQRLAEEINRVFAEEGIGYRRVEDRLVRYDGEVTHSEAVVPALQALATGRYGAANEEFSEAVTDFARGRWRDTLTHANAAFESVLKIRTGEKGEAGQLIRAAKEQGAIPKYLGKATDGLSLLMHALPATRAQQGSAHGLGPKPSEADEHLARLVLVVAAAFIVFLTADRS